MQHDVVPTLTMTSPATRTGALATATLPPTRAPPAAPVDTVSCCPCCSSQGLRSSYADRDVDPAGVRDGITRRERPVTDETPAGTLLEQTVETVVRAARVFSAVTAESIAQAGAGITLPQLRVLVLASASSDLNNNAVAEALDVHISNASRICERLVQAGLLRRRHAPSDRRQVQLDLTPEGARLVAAVADHRRTIFSQTLRAMDDEEQTRLIAALDAFIGVTEARVIGRVSYTP
ncbi:hypothetical protein GCM10009616_31430 [Microlunatus lacustris]